MSDISFSLEDSGSVVRDLEITLRPDNQSLSPVIAVFDNESGTYYAELSEGNWILNYTLGDEKQIWQLIEVGSLDIIGETYQFRGSQLVQGSIHMPQNKDIQAQSIQTVPFQDLTCLLYTSPRPRD